MAQTAVTGQYIKNPGFEGTSTQFLQINKDGIYNLIGNSWVKSEAQYDKSLFLSIIHLDFDALKNDSDKGIKFMANTVDKMVKGIVNDIKTKKNNNKTDKESKKEETNSRNVFSWEKYPQLCKLLFNN